MTPKAYSEVWSILNVLGEEYFYKLPDKLVDFINKEKDNTYNPIYSIEEEFERQNISEDALAFITFLNLKYWCNEAEKDEILNILRENDNKAELEHEMKKIDNQKGNDVKIVTDENKGTQFPIAQEKISFKSKVINIIKSIFKRR